MNRWVDSVVILSVLLSETEYYPKSIKPLSMDLMAEPYDCRSDLEGRVGPIQESLDEDWAVLARANLSSHFGERLGR
jgi:hypothetical protein